MFALTFWSLAVAHGAAPSLVLVHDRDVACADAPAPRRGDPPVVSCTIVPRADGTGPVPHRWSWSVTVQPPTRLLASLHPPKGDWTGGVLAPIGRSLDPVLVTAQLTTRTVRDPIDGAKADEQCLEVRTSLNNVSQVCAPASSVLGELVPLAVNVSPLVNDVWLPVVAFRPVDDAAAASIDRWFTVRFFVERDEMGELADPPYANVSQVYAELAAATAPPIPATPTAEPEPEPEVNLDFLDD